MTFEQSYDESESEVDLNNLKEEILAVQASNIALAAIIANLPETTRLDVEDVKQACVVMGDMDAHTEMVTGEFVAGILDVAKEVQKLNEE